jgi:hypothetical protein
LPKILREIEEFIAKYWYFKPIYNIFFKFNNKHFHPLKIGHNLLKNSHFTIDFIKKCVKTLAIIANPCYNSISFGSKEPNNRT